MTRTYGKTLLDEVEGPFDRFSTAAGRLGLDADDAERLAGLARVVARLRRGPPVEYVDALNQLRRFGKVIGVDAEVIERLFFR
jgi:hypothetical protein